MISPSKDTEKSAGAQAAAEVKQVVAIPQMTLKAWREEAVRRFGPSPLSWRFKCVQCGHTASVRDFDGLTKDPANAAIQECLGRYTKGNGCDWALFGLLQIHKLEVINGNGQAVPVFEFADAPSIEAAQ